MGGNASAGGGINNTGFLDVIDCTIAANHAWGGFGGGGISSNSPMTLTRCTVTNNSAANVGGGIENFSTMTIDACLINENTAARGGGLVGHVPSSTEFKNESRVTGNTVTGDGGGIYSYWSISFDSTCEVTRNAAGGSGGGIYKAGGAVTFNGATVSDNDPNNCASSGGPPDC